jgi:triosephosphate isomerase
MYPGLKLSPPFFEIGPKAYLYGKEVLRLAQFADKMSEKYSVQIIFTPQYVDIPLISRGTKNLLVFAQHMDPIEVGRGIGSVLPEAIKAAGAVGVLLNHAEKPLPFDIIQKTVRRADEVGLATMVCAGNSTEVERIAQLNPNIILAESPELIGVGKREASDQKAVQTINALVWGINPNILVLHGAGISCGKDVFDIIALGAQAAGSTSGIIKAEDPLFMVEEMIRSVREAWNLTHEYR